MHVKCIVDVKQCDDVRKVTVNEQSYSVNNLDVSNSICLSISNLLEMALVTWLILPVVICLPQRLSHACLSLSDYTVRLRTAHYISYSLFDGRLLQG